MAKPKWQEKLQAKLDADPLCFVGNTHHVRHVRCLSPGERQGRKVTLRGVVNFSFNTCEACKGEVR